MSAGASGPPGVAEASRPRPRCVPRVLLAEWLRLRKRQRRIWCWRGLEAASCSVSLWLSQGKRDGMADSKSCISAFLTVTWHFLLVTFN